MAETERDTFAGALCLLELLHPSGEEIEALRVDRYVGAIIVARAMSAIWAMRPRPE